MADTVRDPNQTLERTCFQSYAPYSDRINVRSDVAIVYGIDAGLPDRIKTWRDRRYRIHVMTGVSWGGYQDYLYGRFDGVNHEDEAQTERDGRKISHGGDVYYMCPGQNYGKFLCVGVQRALDAGAEAIHLEEPEFWARGGYSEGFKREWRAYYGEEWIPPHASPDAQWRASKLKYYLYRRALQQVFDHVQAYNQRTGRHVRCYVPTHSLINYAHWGIVSPESSLMRISGCDGYIAQVWTGTSRTPNLYRGRLRERTFETAFLEYGAMQNLVRATGRTIWYLNDPVEDDPGHDWGDYRRNWESTLTASLLQPEVWRYEVMPWPDRIFAGKYPAADDPSKREGIPAAYATELQTVVNALNDMNQKPVRWEGGTRGIGVVVSDTLMFSRGGDHTSDPHLSHFYGLSLPLVKHGIPVEPVQLENVVVPGYLRGQKVIVMTYEGMKPMVPEVHAALSDWVKAGGALVFWDDDRDPYNGVREWWNTAPMSYATPRQHLFHELGLAPDAKPGRYASGKGTVWYHARSASGLASAPDGDEQLLAAVREAARARRMAWREAGYLLLRRGKYVVAAGMDESVAGEPRKLQGAFVDLFDPALRLQHEVSLVPGSRRVLLDVGKAVGPARRPQWLAAACKLVPGRPAGGELTATVEGIADTDAVVLLHLGRRPTQVMLGGVPVAGVSYDAASGLVWLRFANTARARTLQVR